MEFEEIYKQYSPGIFRICMGYLNDYDQAKDVLQETFIAVWQNLVSFRNESNINTWIFRIATNNCLRTVNKLKRTRLVELPQEIPQLEELNNEHALNHLYRCISELEETERIIISLVLEDLPQAEIAAIVGMSNGNVRVKIHRIKEKLSVKIKAHGRFE
jgi:RNA polymerase sigma-70 factor (ECF subfamily)